MRLRAVSTEELLTRERLRRNYETRLGSSPLGTAQLVDAPLMRSFGRACHDRNVGILDRFRKQPETPAARPAKRTVARAADETAHLTIEFSVGYSPLLPISGTTTIARDEARALFERHQQTNLGYLELTAVLQREPSNPVNPAAVAVFVEGERIGYLPSYAAEPLDLSVNGSRKALVQLFSALRNDGVRVEGWIWIGDEPAQWEYDSDNRPPMTTEDKRKAAARGADRMVADAVAGGGERAEEFKAGIVGGIHYLQTVEPIKQLKRDGRLEDALDLCYVAIEGAECAKGGREPAPWYTEQAAIILRKLGRREEEIAVLERWLAATPAERRVGSRIQERLIQIQAK